MTLRSFYRFAVIGTLSLLGIFLALDVLAVFSGYDTAHAVESWPLAVLAFPMLLGAFFAIAICVVWLGMMVDCASRKMPIWWKLLWLIFQVFASVFGTLIYYFCVYNKQRPHGCGASSPSETGSAN